MKNLSRFDLGMIIAFAVVAVLGGAAWWYLSGQLQSVQSDLSAAAGNFDTYSKKEVYLPNRSNVKTLTDNIAVMTAQLSTVQAIDTVTWKHDLDDEVRRLNTAANQHGLVVPKNFYYGFSRYLNQNPPEAATPVLSRQQLAIGQIATILINAPVRGITSVKRTYEEDPPSSDTSAPARTDNDLLPGNALEAPGGVYTAYPFEVEFVCDTEGLRKVVDNLMQSPYVFVIRAVTVQNSKLVSPSIGDLDKMAGTSAASASVINSSPGEVAATQSTVGPQFLFGDETLHVRARIDLIDWHGISIGAPAAGNTPGGRGPRRSGRPPGLGGLNGNNG
jgi:hypothetical protein